MAKLLQAYKTEIAQLKNQMEYHKAARYDTILEIHDVLYLVHK